MTAPEWSNWSGAIRCQPAAVEHPRDEAEIAAVLARARREARVVRPLGAGHSSSPLCATEGVQLSLAAWAGIESIDAPAGRVTVRAGTILHDLGGALQEHGLALANLGDIDRQALAGALATGTHGTGRALGNLASRVAALRLVTAAGERIAIDAREPDLLRAARVSLGALGVVSAVTLETVPAYRLHERVWRAPLAEIAERFDEHAAAHRHFELFYYPRRDVAEAKALDPTCAEPAAVAGREGERIGWSADILPSIRDVRFHEMEYAFPAETGLACFRALVARVRARHPGLAWPLEVRTVAADDAWLSPAHERATIAISVHQDGRKPHQDLFADLEPIFREHRGRPHWGKWHRLDAAALAPLYPRWDAFGALRRRLDPEGRFLSAPLRDLLGA